MDLYLARVYTRGSTYFTDPEYDIPTPPYVLESFDKLRSSGDLPDLLHEKPPKGFMLDSGAFTYLTNHDKAGGVDWKKYLDSYIQFINRNDVDMFYELDIDSVVGTAQVREYRSRLERETGKDSIPVWHPCRGKEAFLTIADEYDYIALGGIYDEISPKWFKHFPWFIKQAHERGAKIHALGFTPMDAGDYKFDSIDSGRWVAGRYGNVHEFDGKTITIAERDESRTGSVDYKNLHAHNLREWTQLARFLDRRSSDPGESIEAASAR